MDMWVMQATVDVASSNYIHIHSYSITRGPSKIGQGPQAAPGAPFGHSYFDLM